LPGGGLESKGGPRVQGEDGGCQKGRKENSSGVLEDPGNTTGQEKKESRDRGDKGGGRVKVGRMFEPKCYKQVKTIQTQGAKKRA